MADWGADDIPRRHLSSSKRLSKTNLRNIFARNKVTEVINDNQQRPGSCSTVFVDRESRTYSAASCRSSQRKPCSQSNHSPLSRSARPCRSQSVTSWDPPPLFQAYPQAIAHASLDASSLPADVILQMNRRKVQGMKENDLDGAKNMDFIAIAKTHTRKQQSASISTEGWTRKLFVLVTSGFLLQYASEGHNDRLPEKMMQLSRNTVAFASDAIPGRHWVLQVSQSNGEGEAATRLSTGLWSRLIRSAETRRTTNDILLVFDIADDLDTWLTIVRKEIEALGGERYRPGALRSGGAPSVLEHRLGHQFGQPQRDVTQLASPPSVSGSISWPANNLHLEESQRNLPSLQPTELHTSRMSHGSSRPSTEVSYSSSSCPSALRNSQYSTVSGTAGSQTSYQSSSPASSPLVNHFPTKVTSSLDRPNAVIGRSFVPPRRHFLVPELFGCKRQQRSLDPELRKPFFGHAADVRWTAASNMLKSSLDNGARSSQDSSSTRALSILPLPDANISETTLQRPSSPTPMAAENAVQEDGRQGPRRPVSTLVPLQNAALLSNSPHSSGENACRSGYAPLVKTTQFTKVNAHCENLTSTFNPVPGSSQAKPLTHPERLSSLQHANGILPSVSSPAPLPQLSHVSEHPHSFARRTTPPSLDGLSTAHVHQLRRPVRMNQHAEVYGSTGAPPRSTSALSLHDQTTTRPISRPHPRRQLTVPNPTMITAASRMRRNTSMPDLGLGPPSGPPPECPLPDVPLSTRAYRPATAMSHRTSVHHLLVAKCPSKPQGKSFSSQRRSDAPSLPRTTCDRP